MAQVCIFPQCGRKRDSKEGYCTTHKKQLRSGKELTSIKDPILICTFKDCGRRHRKQGLCDVHMRQQQKGLELTPVKPNRKSGSGCISTHGYKVHSKRMNGKKIYIYEHRMIMEKYLGRSLLEYENVHHINGNKLDNRIENLELWSSHQPQGQRVIDKIKWAQEILQQYSSEIKLLNDLQSSFNSILTSSVGGECDSHIIFE